MFLIAAFYRFAPLDAAARRGDLARLACGLGVRGSVLMAPEGVNGTIAGPEAAVRQVLAHIGGWPGFAGMTAKEAWADEWPFGRLKVRLKREIVTLGAPVDVACDAGTYVEPADWNAVMADPGTVLVDTRNDYEVALGSFAGALNPGTRAFGDFPAWAEANRERLAGKRVAMFCTGGIRCEKATAWMRGAGHEDVVHLKGGILDYLAQVPTDESLWRGECFVFDDRVAVGHELAPGTARMCHACRRPVRAEDTARPEWEDGVRCHHCADEFTDAQRARFRERMRQMTRAAAEGRAHIGPMAARA